MFKPPVNFWHDDFNCHEHINVMIIDFKISQKQQFDAIILRVKAHPEKYLAFETIADVYQAHWLQQLPAMCTWYVSGLDDGGEDFALSVYFGDAYSVVFYPYRGEAKHN